MYEALLGGSGVKGSSRACELSFSWTELEVLVLAPGEMEPHVSVEELREEGMDGRLPGTDGRLPG